MPKVIVIYDSQTGFTEKMANAVVRGVKSVQGVDVDLLKVGTPFSISKLEDADALILGSPTIYGDVTPAFRQFLDSLKTLQKYIQLSGKIGGIFNSFTWDDDLVVDKLNADMTALGITLVSPPVSIFHEVFEDYSTYHEFFDESSIEKCRELGKSIAMKISSVAD